MTLWGGRFGEPPDRDLWSFTVTGTDHRLLGDDIDGAIAHVEMLVARQVIGPDEGSELLDGLAAISSEARSGEFTFSAGDEDVHSAVERRLGELIGPVAEKLHTARSRNDQVALDLRLYLRRTGRERIGQLSSLVGSLADQAEAAGETVVNAYTHLQPSQAIPLGHYLLAHAWPLLRDIDRFDDSLSRIAVSPLGAGAGGGSSLPIDPGLVAAKLGLGAIFANSLDAVATRDFAAEYSFCCSQALVNCSRLAEELVLWGSEEFGWASYADRHTTGSSALPHKKNPDVAELTRGKAAVSIGSVSGMLALQKGLPLAYNRDLQEDKGLVFTADDALAGALPALTEMVRAARFHPPAPSPWVGALDLAEVLVGRGVSIREAHRIVGELTARLRAADRTLADLTPSDLEASHAAFEPGDVAVVDPLTSVERRRSPGGGSFAAVGAQVATIRRRLEGRT